MELSLANVRRVATWYSTKLRRALEPIRQVLQPMTPPPTLYSVGGGDFKRIGNDFLGYFKASGLRPDSRVLDIGSGIGRMAVPLTRYLTSEYNGLEIVAEGVDWCQRQISSRFPNFHFTRADVYNKHYNPTGRYQARDYRFPYEDSSFDFVFLTSVFTHMLAGDVDQ
jgi:SAM-dependent methyltransferase